jgi:predicted lactoylglutathione lyase
MTCVLKTRNMEFRTMEPRISIITLGVADLQHSYNFYHNGLGFPSTSKLESGIIFFQTGGVCLALYPLEKLAEDLAPALIEDRNGFSGITLAHNTKTQQEVDAILELAVQHGGKLEKKAQKVFWGGYSGYFSDPDGHLWEVAYADFWKFNQDDSLVIE